MRYENPVYTKDAATHAEWKWQFVHGEQRCLLVFYPRPVWEDRPKLEVLQGELL